MDDNDTIGVDTKRPIGLWNQRLEVDGGGLDMPRDQIDTRYGPLAWMTFGEVIGAQVITPEGDQIGMAGDRGDLGSMPRYDEERYRDVSG